MNTDEKIEKLKQEQLVISDAMISVYSEYGWIFEETCSSNIIAITKDGYKMVIYDGKCPNIIGALTTIYNIGGCVFEGRLETPEEVVSAMKMIGFEIQAILNVYRKCGWDIVESSSLNISAKTIDGYTMIIKNGRYLNNCGLTSISGHGCVFNGKIETTKDAILLMKMLRFEKQQ